MKKLTNKEKQNLLTKLHYLKSAREDFYLQDSKTELNTISQVLYKNCDLSYHIQFNLISMEDLKLVNHLFNNFKRKVNLFKSYTLELYEKKSNKFALIYNVNKDAEDIINLQNIIYYTLCKYSRDRDINLYNIPTYLFSLMKELSSRYFINEISQEEREKAEKEELAILAKEKAKALQDNFLYQKVMLLFNLCGIEFYLEELQEEKAIKLDNIERTITYYENILQEDSREDKED